MQQCTSSTADPISRDDNPSQIRLLTLVLSAIPVSGLLLIALRVDDGYYIIVLFSFSFLSPIFLYQPKSAMHLPESWSYTNAILLLFLVYANLFVSGLSFELSIRQCLRGSMSTFLLTLSSQQG